MSDGMSDSHALGRLSRDLEHAAMNLRNAIRHARKGHRGLTVSIEDTVNHWLEGSGYRLQGGHDDHGR